MCILLKFPSVHYMYVHMYNVNNWITYALILLSVLFDILGTHNSIVHLREKMCEKRIKYNHEKGRRISLLLYLFALSPPPQIPLPSPPIGLPLLRYLAHFPHLISKAKTAKIQESMKRGDTRLDILWSILDQNCALF